MKDISDKTLETKKEEVIKAIENNSDRSNYWKYIEDISELSGYGIKEVRNIIENSEPKSLFKPSIFVQNSEGKYSTRKAYKKYASFFKKFMDSFELRIN